VNINPSVRYAGPFVAFMILLALFRNVSLPELTSQSLFVGVMAIVIYVLARPVLNFKVHRFLPSLILGVLTFFLWIGPDLISPAWRHLPIFDNAFLGHPEGSLSEAERSNAVVLLIRSLRAAIIVPIVEELFWRAWLMRWIISPRFESIALGAYAPFAFWIVALLFASEHGSYWDVGLATGILWNWWMIRTKSLGDLILVHAVTNACLCAYVVLYGKWEYWL
jgi:CAAX prenyl protease-like protein